MIPCLPLTTFSTHFFLAHKHNATNATIYLSPAACSQCSSRRPRPSRAPSAIGAAVTVTKNKICRHRNRSSSSSSSFESKAKKAICSLRSLLPPFLLFFSRGKSRLMTKSRALLFVLPPTLPSYDTGLVA